MRERVRAWKMVILSQKETQKDGMWGWGATQGNATHRMMISAIPEQVQCLAQRVCPCSAQACTDDLQDFVRLRSERARERVREKVRRDAVTSRYEESPASVKSFFQVNESGESRAKLSNTK